MAKLIPVKEAADRLGVTRQTLLNWAESGVIKITKQCQKNKAYLVDWETLEPLCGTVNDMMVAKEWFEQRKRDYEEATKELETMIKDAKDEIIARKRLYPFVNQLDFYLSIPDALCSIGRLKEREAVVVKKIIQGATFEEIGDELCLTSERVRQIFCTAIRKSSHLEHLRDELDEYEALKRKYTSLKSALEVMDNDFKEYLKMRFQTNDDSKKNVEDAKEQELINLLSTQVTQFNFSVRCLNCLRSADIRTVGDIVRCRKTDFLRLRNFGRKSLTELDDFLEEHDLEWGMDVDGLYRKNAILNA